MNLYSAIKASADQYPTATVIMALIAVGYGPLTELDNIARDALTSVMEERHQEVEDLSIAALLEALKDADIVTYHYIVKGHAHAVSAG